MSIKLKSGMGGSRGGRGRTEKTATLKGESKKRRRAAGKRETSQPPRVVISLDDETPAIIVHCDGQRKVLDDPAKAALEIYELEKSGADIFLSSSVHFAETECTSPWLRAFARQLNGET